MAGSAIKPMHMLLCAMIATILLLGWLTVSRLADHSQSKKPLHAHPAVIDAVPGLNHGSTGADAALKELFGTEVRTKHIFATAGACACCRSGRPSPYPCHTLSNAVHGAHVGAINAAPHLNNTPATKNIIGRAGRQTCSLEHLTVTSPRSPCRRAVVQAAAVGQLHGETFEQRVSAAVLAQEAKLPPRIPPQRPGDRDLEANSDPNPPADVEADVLEQADAALARINAHAQGGLHPEGPAPANKDTRAGKEKQQNKQNEKKAKDTYGDHSQPKKKKTIEEKVAEWRARDKFWLQKGAITSLLGPVCMDSGNGRWAWALRVWGCHKKEVGINQRFELDSESRIRQQIKAKVKCLEDLGSQVSGTMHSTSERLVMKECKSGDDAQKWAYTKSASLHKVWGTLRNAKSGECLTKHRLGRNSTNERSLAMMPCRNGCNQTWSFGDRPINWPNEVAEVRKPKSHDGLRVLCWILTYPAAADTRAAGVNNTWGRRCNILLYMTTEHVADLNTVKLDLGGPEGRNMLWTKSKMAWLHVYAHYRDKADWFMKADDDTYVVMDHLKQYLGKYDTNELHHFGRKFTMYKDSYYSGGSGIILSKGALLKMGETFKTPQDEGWSGTPRGTGPEDLLTSKSLKPLGIDAVESTDKQGRQLFMPMGIDHEYFAPRRDENAWFYRCARAVHARREGGGRWCSTVSAHACS